MNPITDDQPPTGTRKTSPWVWVIVAAVLVGIGLTAFLVNRGSDDDARDEAAEIFPEDDGASVLDGAWDRLTPETRASICASVEADGAESMADGVAAALAASSAVSREDVVAFLERTC